MRPHSPREPGESATTKGEFTRVQQPAPFGIPRKMSVAGVLGVVGCVVALWTLGIGLVLRVKPRSVRTAAFNPILLHGALRGDEAETRWALTQGAHVNARDYGKWTPLICAAVADNQAIAQVLLEHGATLEAKDKDGYTPLMWAAGKNHPMTVRLLLSVAADTNTRDIAGRTVLMAAATGGSRTIVKDLLSHGADVSAKDHQGRTAEKYATLSGMPHLVDLLRKAPPNGRSTVPRTR